MTIATRTHVTPRYGSPAEVAAFLGVSVKTVRRAVESGSLASYRVGRRVLVAYRDADQLVRRNPTMSIARATEQPPIDPDTGRPRAPSAEERRARSEALNRALDEIEAIVDESGQDDTPEVWAEVFRGIDASRPHRPLFEGRY